MAVKVKACKAKEPLQVKIVNDRLVISVGIEVLAFAAENCERFYDGEKDAYTLKVTDKAKFAIDVARELNREKENGETPVSVLLDQAFEDAVGDGSEGVKYPVSPIKPAKKARKAK